MTLEWIMDEQRFCKGCKPSLLDPGMIFETDERTGRSFIEQGLAVERKHKARKTEKKED